MGEKLLCSHPPPMEILLYSSFSGGKYYYGGKTTLQHRLDRASNPRYPKKESNTLTTTPRQLKSGARKTQFLKLVKYKGKRGSRGGATGVRNPPPPPEICQIDKSIQVKSMYVCHRVICCT